MDMARKYIDLYAYIYIYKSIYVCVYIYIYKEVLVFVVTSFFIKKISLTPFIKMFFPFIFFKCSSPPSLLHQAEDSSSVGALIFQLKRILYRKMVNK